MRIFVFVFFTFEHETNIFVEDVEV